MTPKHFSLALNPDYLPYSIPQGFFVCNIHPICFPCPIHHRSHMFHMSHYMHFRRIISAHFLTNITFVQRSQVDLPWHVLLAARWPIAQLMAMLGRALLMLVGEAVPNRCDEVGSDRTICWKVSNKNKWPNIFSQNIPKYPEQKRVFFFRGGVRVGGIWDLGISTIQWDQWARQIMSSIKHCWLLDWNGGSLMMGIQILLCGLVEMTKKLLVEFVTGVSMAGAA